MSIEGQGHFFTIYFPGFVCFVLYLDKMSGERLQDHWSSGLLLLLLITASIPSIGRRENNKLADTFSCILNADIRSYCYVTVSFHVARQT